jgi:hypothetical protein
LKLEINGIYCTVADISHPDEILNLRDMSHLRVMSHGGKYQSFMETFVDERDDESGRGGQSMEEMSRDAGEVDSWRELRFIEETERVERNASRDSRLKRGAGEELRL